MKLGKIEKWFLNKESHSIKIINQTEKLLNYLDINPNSNFLEIGCGSGAVSIHIAERYKWKVAGADVDEEQIILAKDKSRNIKNITFLEADATNLPFKSQVFDLVLSINVLHHISNWLDALGEIDRVLKKGGCLLLVELLFTSFSKLIGKLYSKQNYGITTKANLDAFMDKNNYKIIYYNLSSSLLWKNISAIYRK